MEKLKQMFFVLVMMMVSVTVWGAPEVVLTHNDASYIPTEARYRVKTGQTPFAKPTVKVMDGTTDLTGNYTITYTMTSNGTGSSIISSNDDTNGNVTIGGTSGNETVTVTATKISDFSVLSTTYNILVGPFLDITHTDDLWDKTSEQYNVMVGYAKLAEPTIRVMNGNTNDTDLYTITYNTSTTGNAGDETLGVGSTDARGVAIFTDDATKTTVEEHYGEVVAGKKGTVYIKVTATKKSDSSTLTAYYKINIDATAPTVTFVPTLSSPIVEGHAGTMYLTTKKDQYNNYPAISTPLPECKITIEANGVTHDITDRFTITKTYSGSTFITQDGNMLKFAQTTTSPESQTGTVTYSFAPKTGYENLYDDITDKLVDVRFNVLGADEKKTLSMQFTRNHIKQENVTEDDGAFTIHVYKYGKSDLGDSNNTYQYKTPTPSLVDENGTLLPINGTGTGGTWDDFKLIFKIVEDNTYFDDCMYDYKAKSGEIVAAGQATGLTIGEYMYQVAKPGLVKVAVYGALEGTSNDGGYGAKYKSMYEPYKVNDEPLVITDQWGGKYTAYTAPQYFYIDVMKRKPVINMDPDPSGLYFFAGDEITMDQRFEISAYKSDDSNGIEGFLKFGANEGSETDHFHYSFFISDRMDAGKIRITKWVGKYQVDGSGNVKYQMDGEDYVLDEYGQKIPLLDEDWVANGGNQFSWIDWFPTGHKSTDTGADIAAIQAGDMIKTGQLNITLTEDFDAISAVKATGTSQNIIGQTVTVKTTSGNQQILLSPGNIDKLISLKKDTVITLDTYTLVTAENRGTLSSSHPNLVEGDYERGVTYNSMKDYGNEDWTMKFITNGEYDVPYTVLPWNHTRIDSSDATTVKFRVISNPVPTELVLSYYYKVIKEYQAIAKPDEKVVVPAWNNYDVTEYFNITYALTTPGEWSDTGDSNVKRHTATNATINLTTGALDTSSTSTTGTFTITVGAQKKNNDIPYVVPNPKEYTINIVNGANLAQWEVISTCKTNPCAEHATVANQRFDFDNATELKEALGRMHFLTKNGWSGSSGDEAGDIYGGTIIEGVPGITMTLGTAYADESAGSDWKAIATSADGTKKCCNHEEIPVVVRSKSLLSFRSDNKVLPETGTFYKFNPTVNGFLTIDAKIYDTHTIVLIDGESTEDNKIDEVIQLSTLTPAERAALVKGGGKITKFDGEGNTGNLLGDYTFKKPLLAGHEYYLYDVTGTTTDNLNLHGFSFEPAYIHDRSTTLAESQAPFTAYTFMNGLSSSLPTLLQNVSTANPVVTFEVANEATNDPAVSVTASDYIGIDDTHKDAITPKMMTLNGDNIFKLRVKATVTSTDATLGDCINKVTYYDVSVIDIPTYAIGSDATTYAEFQPNKKVYTENIKTDIVMTFGGWEETDPGTDDKYHYNDKDYADKWEYKSKAGAHSRIGSELADNDLTYNKTIDGFEYFTGGKNNPVDELNGAALQNQTIKKNDVEQNNPRGYNNGVYNYASGVEYEKEGEGQTFYNTTYKLPCRGSFLKFEPRESGILLVYLVQNGSCDYHDGVTEVGTTYQVKWRPLYITDETGLPVEMVNSFGNISKFVPSGEDATNSGEYTLGISRCGPQPDIIKNAWNYDAAPDANKVDGCYFDWSLFKGTDQDKQDLLDAWPAKGEHQSIIRLDNGGFVLPHKAYVRYSFNVKAGKTYFVFQPGSKPEFGGFSFVPTGYPDHCKYTIDSKPDSYKFNATNQEKNWAGEAATSEVTYTSGTLTAEDPQTQIGDVAVASRNKAFSWDTQTSQYTSAGATNHENLVITINDIQQSKVAANDLKPRAFTANKWESICLPFSVSEQEMTRVFGEGYVLVTCAGVVSDTDQRLHFIRHANQYIEAGRPYFIMPKQNVTALSFRNITVEGGTLVKKWNGSSALVDQTNKVPYMDRFFVNVNNEYTFRGTYSYTKMNAGSYWLAGEGDNYGLHPTSKAAPIGGYRAFFQKDSGATGNSLLAYFISDYTQKGIAEGEGDVTGIISIDEDGSISTIPADSGVYTVSGQKISDNPLDFNSSAKGIYIINGKKYVK